MEQLRGDAIAIALEDAIFDGEIAEGARLDEVRLAARFGTSRTPVREALRKLATTGLVEQIPHRGTFVRQTSPADLLSMFEVMAELEAACARFAALRAGPADLAAIRLGEASCRAAAGGSSADRYFAENETFHRAIYRACGNTHLEADALRLARRLSPYRRKQLHLHGRLAQSLAEHGAMLAAIASGEAEAAARATREHVAVQGALFHSLLSAHRAAAEQAAAACARARPQRQAAGSRS